MRNRLRGAAALENGGGEDGGRNEVRGDVEEQAEEVREDRGREDVEEQAEEE